MSLHLLCQRSRLLKALLTHSQLGERQAVADSLSPGWQLWALNLVSEDPASLRESGRGTVW